MANETWFVVDVEVDSNAMEAIEFGLNELDAGGTEINNLGKVLGESVRVSGYFDAPQDEEIVRGELNAALRVYNFEPQAIREIFIRKLANVDWLYEWKKHWKPTEIGRFIISPTWENFDNATGKLIIYIDPAMAFGTGTHETTQLCVKAIAENFSPEMSFFDVGTGTGVLAIAAHHLAVGNQKIIGCDTDANSIAIAIENAKLNNAEAIEFYVGSIDDKTEKFDFVCANLTIDVILPILKMLLEKSEKVLLLSGILKEQEDEIAQALKNMSVSDFHVETSGSWISVTIKK